MVINPFFCRVINDSASCHFSKCERAIYRVYCRFAARSQPSCLHLFCLEAPGDSLGAYSVIYSTNPDADRAFLRDVMKLTNVDAGGGYVIFGLPPSEVPAICGRFQPNRGCHATYLLPERRTLEHS